ncbi:MAG: chloride channel protein [Clostridia bacterium]|nr:chloride channel protein [Clostridia bacterium]
MLTKKLKEMFYYARSFAAWVAFSIAVGAVCGVAGGAFAITVEEATHLRQHTAWLPWLMPVAGLLIALLYHLLKLPLSIGTDEIIKTVRTQEGVSLKMAPAIFISTALTHLTGGSAGREGAALQLGGSIGVAMSRMVKPLGDNRRIFQLCGMAALFSALFGTPIAATIFVLEIIDIGKINTRALLPCLVAALTAKLVAMAIGAPAEAFPLAGSLADTTWVTLLQSAGVGLACGVVAILFCCVMHASGKHLRKAIPNDYLRIALGGAAVALLAVILGTADYQGSGMHVILSALQGNAAPEAFLLKILFTALTLGVGFKGGEIVPSFFVGATLGCTVAPLLGLNPALGAGLGIIAMFCGVTNGALASIALSVELFGAEYLPLFGIAVAVSYAMSGHVSLYHTQQFLEPKMGHRE